MVGRGAAEQDVAGHGLVQHGAARAGVGRALAVAAHALVRQGPVQGAPGGQTAHRRRLRKDSHRSQTVTDKEITAPVWAEGRDERGRDVGNQLDGWRAAVEHRRRTGREDGGLREVTTPRRGSDWAATVNTPGNITVQTIIRTLVYLKCHHV